MQQPSVVFFFLGTVTAIKLNADVHVCLNKACGRALVPLFVSGLLGQ